MRQAFSEVLWDAHGKPDVLSHSPCTCSYNYSPSHGRMQNLTFCHAYLHRSYQHCPLGTSQLSTYPILGALADRENQTTIPFAEMLLQTAQPRVPVVKDHPALLPILLPDTIQHFVQHPLPACLLPAFLKAHVCSKHGFISLFAILQENLCMGTAHSWKKTTELQDKA